MNREKFLEERRSGIGASDAPVICGLSPWKTPLELYYEKRGEIEEPDLSDNDAVRTGLDLEDYVAQRFAEASGLQVSIDPVGCRRHSENEWMLAHLDRLVDENSLLECKTTSAFQAKEWGSTGSDKYPEMYYLQVQHQMAVTGFEVGYLAVLIGGQYFRWYTIPRDNEIIESLIEIEAEFWERVQMGNPPDPAWDKNSTEKLLKKVFSELSGKKITLSEEALHWVKVWQDAAEKVKQYDSVVQTAKNHLLWLMKDASQAEVPGLEEMILERSIKRRRAYEVPACTYIDFRLKKVRNKK